MRNRLSKCSKHVAFAACMLALGGSFTACQDEYTLDEVKPSWLNSSIYETLESNGNYTNYLRLIADPDVNTGSSEEGSLVQILSRTGSKTVFAATDEAWTKFFEANKLLPASNPWHYAQSYDQLSKSQKKLLLHTSMLNNAIVMENLASSSGSKPTRGQYLRRKTDVELVDSVTRIAIKDLPRTYWSADKQASEDGAEFPEVNQWSRIFTGENYSPEDSIYMVTDNSVSMMIHFTNEYMAKKQIKDTDFRIIMGRERSTTDVHVYDALLDSADIVCENGYVNMTEKPLVPLANMAEVIRTNGRTNIFSHLLDRFSVPYQNKSISKLFSQLNPSFNEETDTLYTKRYYSGRSFGGGALSRDERGNTFGGSTDAILRFDPGWNGYYPESSQPEEDMGAMFVPNDEVLLKYFIDGGGKILLEEYTKDREGNYNINDLETLYRDIDQIPLNKIYAIINHCMFTSFANSVPSKMLGLREEVTLEQIFTEKDTKLKIDNGNIDTVMVACNGAVYIMNNVLTPSDFNCVTTPAYIKSTNKIMNWAIYSDYTLPLAGLQPKIGLNYYAYLKAMQSRFSFFMPNDNAMQYYYDPMSFTSNQPRVKRFTYIKGSDQFPFETLNTSKRPPLASYDVNTGKIGGKIAKDVDESEFINRFRNMLEDFTVVHENGVNTINTDEDEYYLSKNGMGIKVIREETEKGKKVVKVQGGFQLENEREHIPHSNPGIQYCNVTESGDYKNGSTFTLDAPIIPAARSVFSVISNIKRGQVGDDQDYLNDEALNTNPYLEFFKLCNGYIEKSASEEGTPFGMEDLIKKSGLVDESQYNVQVPSQLISLNKAVEKYLTFYDNNAVDQNVTFFNNYRYTVYVPSNEALLEAITNGLPTWESIQDDFDNSIDENGVLKSAEDSLRIQAKILYLTNFIRTHFADKTFFADKTEKSEEMTTSSFNNNTGLFVKVTAKREKIGNETMLMVKDNTKQGEWINTIYQWERNGVSRDVKNILTCDRECSETVKKQELGRGKTTISTSFAVVHLIDGILNHVDLEEGKHSITWETPKAARQYIQKFAIR